MKTTSAFLLSVLCCAASTRGQTHEWTEHLNIGGDHMSNAVSADGLGNVYISGWTEDDFGEPNGFLSKYDASGTREWTEYLDDSRIDGSSGVSADGLGNVYVSGATDGSPWGASAGGEDAFIVKYDDTGTLQWSRQLGTNSNEESFGVSADTLGNVYISGLTLGSFDGNSTAGAFTSKYDASGTLQWTQQFSGVMSRGVSADGLGNVFISGITPTSRVGPPWDDVFLSKYDSNGTLEWTRQLGSSDGERSGGVSADGLGNVYISGSTSGLLTEIDHDPGIWDAFLSKYDASGALLWTRQIGTDNHNDQGDGVSADGLGHVYVSGHTFGDMGAPNNGGTDVYVSKYDASGTLHWSRQLGTTDYEKNGQVTADILGNVYVSSRTGANGGSTWDTFVAKFTTDFSAPVADLDGNGDVDGNDVDALVREIVAGTNNSVFDLTADGTVSNADLSQWLSDAAAANGFAAPYLFGDANLDGAINASDLNALGQNWLSQPNTWQLGDFTANGTVDASDLNELAQNWQRTVPIAGAVLMMAGDDAYIQTFDEALGTDGFVTGTKLPTGWTVTDHGIEGNSVALSFPIDNKIPRSDATTATFNAGAENDPDRALAVGVRDNPDEMFLQLFAQVTGNNADAFQLQFDVEAWDAEDGVRLGDTIIVPGADNPGEAAFHLTVDIDSGDGFTSLVDLGSVTTGPFLEPVFEGIVDGNAEVNRISFDSGFVTTSIPRDSLLRFRWTPDPDAPTNGWVFGIDNVSLSLFAGGAPASVPEPSGMALLYVGAVIAGLMRLPKNG